MHQKAYGDVADRQASAHLQRQQCLQSSEGWPPIGAACSVHWFAAAHRRGSLRALVRTTSDDRLGHHRKGAANKGTAKAPDHTKPIGRCGQVQEETAKVDHSEGRAVRQVGLDSRRAPEGSRHGANVQSTSRSTTSRQIHITS